MLERDVKSFIDYTVILIRKNFDNAKIISENIYLPKGKDVNTKKGMKSVQI